MESLHQHAPAGSLPGDILHGKNGRLILSSSLFVLSALLTIVSGIFIGISAWVFVPVLLWEIFLAYLFRYNSGAFGFWKLVYVFIIYIFVLGILNNIALPEKTTVSVPTSATGTR